MRYVAVVVLVALCASAAHADWQYTRWGMTPEEVRAAGGASVGTATAEETAMHSPKDADQRALLKAPFSSGKFQFQAWFMFSGKKKLNRVILHLTDISRCSDLIDGLRDKYGKPFEQRTPDKDDALPPFTEWRTKTDSIAIQAHLLKGNSHGFCDLIYTPLIDADKEKL